MREVHFLRKTKVFFKIQRNLSITAQNVLLLSRVRNKVFAASVKKRMRVANMIMEIGTIMEIKTRKFGGLESGRHRRIGGSRYGT